MDAGTMESLLDAADFVRMIESRQGVVISAPEEVAYRNGWIGRSELVNAAERYGKSLYGQHLKTVAEGRIISRVSEKRHIR
jgi:glucose-1-phosphate thymidylyltransferase